MKRRAVFLLRALLPALFLLLPVSTARAAVIPLAAFLTGAQENPPNGSSAFGFASFLLDDVALTMTYNITVFGLDFTGSQTPGTPDNLTAAHIHNAAVGTNGPVRFGFFGAPFNDNNPNDVVVTPFGIGVGGTISGKWDAPEGNSTTLAAQIPNILGGLTYVNFHTVQFGGGEIRGQIAPVPEPGTLLLLGTGVVAMIRRRVRRRSTDSETA